jgi:hypothetical protein
LTAVKGSRGTFQEQKRSSAAFVPLESPRREWPCTFFVQHALSGSYTGSDTAEGVTPSSPPTIMWE